MTSRRGFTLIELVVVLSLLGVTGAAMGMLLLRQQRFYRGASELLYARESVRDALDVLATDLRGTPLAPQWSARSPIGKSDCRARYLRAILSARSRLSPIAVTWSCSIGTMALAASGSATASQHFPVGRWALCVRVRPSSRPLVTSHPGRWDSS